LHSVVASSEIVVDPAAFGAFMAGPEIGTVR
jgi:hypothetical protein